MRRLFRNLLEVVLQTALRNVNCVMPARIFDHVRIACLLVLLACEPRRASDVSSGSNVPLPTIEDSGHTLDASPTAKPFALLPCRPQVQGHSFRGAVILCIAFQAASITSVALDDPMRKPEAVTALEALADEALAPPAVRGFPRDSVLYRGLVALVLAALERLAPNNSRSQFFDEIVSGLAKDLEAGWVQSYEGETYPCDHAPALSALRLHSVLRGSSPDAADHLAQRLRSVLEHGFPTSTKDGTERATTLAFTAAFLLPAEQELATQFAERFVTFCDRGLMTACREWRKPHRADAASGSIIAGYSVGATALGLPATRTLPTWHAALELTAAANGADTLDEHHPLEAALVRYGETARTWR